MPFAYYIFSQNRKAAKILMNVLIQIKDSSTDREIKEFTEGKNDKVFITHSPEESIEILSQNEIHKAVISLKNLKDATILKYLNEYHPDIEVVVLATKAFDDIISIFSKTNYSIIHEPLKLSELKGKLNSNGNNIQKTKNKTN